MAELYGNRVQSTVQTEYIPFVIDTVLNSNVFFQRTVRGAKKWGGRTIRQSIKVSKNSTGGSFRGFDTFAVSATDNRQVLEYTPSWYQITSALPDDELSVAEAAADKDNAILDLMRLTLQSDTEDMADDLGTLFYADGTGNAGKDPLGLGALVDDGSVVSTIGGLSRSTYPTLASTVTASLGTLTLAKLDTLWMAVTSGSQKPGVGAATESVFNSYGQLLRPQERINKEAGSMKSMKGGTGFSGLAYNSATVLPDEKCTSGMFAFLNEDFIDFYALPKANAKSVKYKNQVEGNDYESPVGLGFSWSDWIIPTNSASVVGHIYFGGQFIAKNPKRSGKLTGITGI